MKIAIHHVEGSFSNRWVKFCLDERIDYKLVNPYETNIMSELKSFDLFLWPINQGNYKDVLFAKQLLFSLQQAGKNVFPDFNTVWHFDDKVGQKYLLESIGAPLVPSFVFYDKRSSLKWINKTDFPKVFKLRGGAGSQNVSLLRDKKSAINKTNVAFNSGFSQFNRIGYFKERLRKVREKQDSYLGILKGFVRLFIGTEFSKMRGKEKGYIYFQDFIPNNNSDIRVIVIGDKAFAIERFVRKGDFRASGSGKIKYLNNANIDQRCLEISFETSRKLETQCLAYDYVYDRNDKPLIVEISYGFSLEAYDACLGYWDKNLKWYNASFNPQVWIIKDLIQKHNVSKR